MPLFPLNTRVLRLLSLPVFGFLLAAIQGRAQSTSIVISQVYGAGGNSGATYNADYVELFNLSASSVTLTGWAIQYGSGSATGTTIANVNNIPTVTLAPGQYYLISATPGTTGAALPAADATISTIAFGASAGKVFLTNTTTMLTSSCPGAGGSVVDFVAYGTTATCAEGSPTSNADAAPAPSTTLADFRAKNGCTDTDNNLADFATAAAAPRNTATTKAPCVAAIPIVNPSLAGTLASPASIPQGGTTLLTTTVTKGTNAVSTVTVDTSALGGATTQTLYDDGTHGDKTAGDGTYSFSLTVPNNQTTGNYTLTFTAKDSAGNSGTATAPLAVTTAGALGASSGSATPSSVTSGFATLLTATVTPSTSPASTGITVTADLSAFTGGSSTQTLYDDGTHGDKTAGDNIYGYSFTVPAATVPVGSASQNYTINFTAKDAQLRSATTSAALTVVAPIPPSISSFTLAESTTAAYVGSPVTFTAVVTGNMSSAPNGTVTFLDGGKTLGTGTLAAGTSSSTYTYTTSALAIASHTITATFSGDTLYPNSSTTTPASVTTVISAVPIPDFSFTVSNQGIVVNGSSKFGTSVVSVGFLNGFNSPVAITCSGLPGGSRCSLAPATLTTSGNSVLTVAIDGASLHQRNNPWNRNQPTALALGFLALPFLLRRKLRNRLGKAGTTVCVLFLGIALLGMSGCGNGSYTNTGTSTLTITGTGGTVTHTATLTLTVQ